jgi:hypothetical protein
MTKMRKISMKNESARISADKSKQEILDILDNLKPDDNYIFIYTPSNHKGTTVIKADSEMDVLDMAIHFMYFFRKARVDGCFDEENKL